MNTDPVDTEVVVDKMEIIKHNVIGVPHNGKPIVKMEVSPNSKYLVTYSEVDHSIVGWKVESIAVGSPIIKNETTKDYLEVRDMQLHIDEGRLEPDITINTKPDDEYKLIRIRVSDDKKLGCIYTLQNFMRVQDVFEIIDMNTNKKIKLDFDDDDDYVDKDVLPDYYTFNLKGEFVFYKRVDDDKKIIRIHSTQDDNGKWLCKSSYKIPGDFELISISKYDKLYLFSNNYVYEWGIHTEKVLSIFVNEKSKLKEDDVKDIRIASNEKFICLRVKNNIMIYSLELETPIATLDMNNDIQLYNFMDRTGLYPLLPSLIELFHNTSVSEHWDKIMKNCWKERLGILKKNNQLPVDYQVKSSPSNIQTTTRFAFGTVDGYVWKIKSGNLKFASSYGKSEKLDDDIIDSWNSYLDSDESWKYLNIHLFNPYMDTIYALFRDITIDEREEDLIKWRITSLFEGLELQVYKKTNNGHHELICEKLERIKIYYCEIFNSLLFINDDIAILTTMGLFIYHFNESNKSIILNYFYFMDLRNDKGDGKKTLQNQYFMKHFSSPTLPLPNYESFRLNGWISCLKDNKESLLKYGAELLKFAIKERKLQLIEDIYKSCIDYFKEDGNNQMFLGIISSTLPLLDEYYPKFITKFSSETNMIINASFYDVQYRDGDLHLHSFTQNPQLINLDKSKLWTEYQSILREIQQIGTTQFIKDFLSQFIASEHKSTPTITFMIPYIRFVNYPKEYNRKSWIWDWVKPQPSPFIETVRCKEIYKTWNGEALINFKWDKFGKHYYYGIWVAFLALLLCFTFATLPPSNLSEEVRRKFLIASIVIGLVMLGFEIRQTIYSPKSWWQYFDLLAYGLPTFFSVYLLDAENRNSAAVIQLISCSCLLLDLKLLLFFRVFRSYGRYFAIIISVARKVYFFLIVFLTIIMISFAHAFYILLSPRLGYSLEERTINDDPNNPWNIAPTFKVFQDDQNEETTGATMIQVPDDNTNMFVDYRTALFAVISFLSGDSSALSNWSYGQNPTLAILMVFFTFLTVIYLLNVFIGLYSEAMNDDLVASQLILKAEILAKIELFYLLPHQRRWKSWFPEVLYYYADLSETRKEVNEAIDKSECITTDLQTDLLRKLK